ncbi:MAG: substrate-binding domain-containing protein [Planctomycetota bacterium]
MGRFSLSTLAALLLVLGPISCGPAKPDEGPLVIAVIPKGTTHEFWKAIHAGALEASRELGVKVEWKGPVKEDDRAAQIRVVEDFITAKVDGIVLAPLDDTALAGVVHEATAEGIPVVIIDSGLQSQETVSFVATDNYKGGELAGKRLGERLGGKGKVLMLRYQEGSASTMQREAGFLDRLKADFPEIEVVSSNQYGGATTETSYQAAENLLVRFEQLDGIFCPNESTTFGMLRALQDAGRAGKLVFVGFDSSQKLIDALRSGEIDALVLQNPYRMGELGVRTMVDHLQGKNVAALIDTGVALATRENMETPEIGALLSPDLSALK